MLKRRQRDNLPSPFIYSQAKAVVEAIQYKPGWKISLTPGQINITFMALDSVDQECETEVTINSSFDPLWFRTEEKLLAFVREAITQAELHERDEWFRYNGELLDDPHGPGRHGRVEINLP